VESEQEDLEGWEEGNDDVHMTDSGESSGTGLGTRMPDSGRPDSASSFCGLYRDKAEHRFCASTHEIGESLLGRTMTPKDFITSQEDQRDSSENIVTKRKRCLARNGQPMIDLEAAAR